MMHKGLIPLTVVCDICGEPQPYKIASRPTGLEISLEPCRACHKSDEDTYTLGAICLEVMDLYNKRVVQAKDYTRKVNEKES